MDELKKLLENAGMAEANPDGTIGDDEQERIAELMATFESELDDLISYAMQTAEEIGGQFRAPGIKQAIRQLMQQKQTEMRRNRSTPSAQGGATSYLNTTGDSGQNFNDQA